MKKPLNQLNLKTDKIVSLSTGQAKQLMGGRPTTGTCQQFTVSCNCYCTHNFQKYKSEGPRPSLFVFTISLTKHTTSLHSSCTPLLPCVMFESSILTSQP